MPNRQLTHKAFLVSLIAVTAAIPPLFIQLDEPTLRLNIWKVLAKIGSLSGTVLMFWQFVLGYRQAAARWATPDYLWVIGLHRRLGVTAGALILLHPVFITPYYLDKQEIWLFSFNLPSPLGTFVPLGITALAILAVIILTSTLLRDRMRRESWFATHLSSYILLPLAFVHGYPIGMTLNRTGLKFVWQGLFVLTGLFYIFRILGRAGVLSSVYEVVRVRHVAESVVDIAMRPLRRALHPASAQFAFFRRCRLCGARPFTISKYDRNTGELNITVKELGKTTRRLQETKPGERFFVEGPFGVFGREAFTTNRPVVMLAGGIGVTPFRRMIHELRELPGRKAFLFYGNQYEKDIAHREEMESAGHVDVIHILSGVEEHEKFETGFISTDLMKRYLGDDLSANEFFICGPPVMIRKLESGLIGEGVPESQIHHELFSY